MDRECASLLPRVCAVLADPGRTLPDDTSLEKLLDWFTGLTEAGGSLLGSHPCLLDFISTVVDQASPDPAVLAFALKLCGAAAAAEDGFDALRGRSVLDRAFERGRWRGTGLWEDPCVRIGWIQGCRSMLRHPRALGFLVRAGFAAPLLRLQTDASLFVTSAAGETLAHVLLSFQPRDGAAQESGPDYAAVLRAVSEYLEESLVPGDEARVHHSRRLLKLLVPLLHRAGPPLRDELLRAVTGPLEELVAAGYSQLTPALMDVILAAHSSGTDGRVARLLPSLLSGSEPVDLVHAAAAFLCGGHRDAVHTARAVRILLLPLQVVTGHTLLDAAEEEHRRPLEEQLRSKTSCISVMCVCLTHAPRVALTPPDLLPCPPGVIVAAVLSLLRLCGGDSPPAAAELLRNVVGSGRVQKSALEALTGLSGSPGAADRLDDVCAVLIRYLDSPDSDPAVLHKSYRALLRWTGAGEDTVAPQLRAGLLAAVRKRACDVRWEVRDSTVEFLGEAAGSGRAALLLDGHGAAAPLLAEALRDPESYVRASAVAALALTQAPGWRRGAELSPEQVSLQTDVASRLLRILSEDTEGFARRAVVRYFIAWFSSSSSSSSSSSPSSSRLLTDSVRSVLSLGSADLDWEVKVHTLELAELLLDEAFRGCRGNGRGSGAPPAPALRGAVEQGVVAALLSGLVDCDRPVGLKACQLLIALRDAVCPPQDAGVSAVTVELPGRGWGREIGKMAEEGGGGGGPGGEGGVHVGVCALLTSLGLDARRDTLTQSSDHVHNSPLSLLQDILTAAHTQPDAQPGREVVVDCY